MASRIAIVGLVLVLVVVSANAGDPPAADSKAPAGTPSLFDDDKPRALTPFANSPEMSASLADGPSNQLDFDDENSDALLGSPTPAKAYGQRDPDPTASSAPIAVSSAAAAVSVAAAAAAGSSYLFF